MTAVMRLADARLAASIMISCSMIASLTDSPRGAVRLDDEDVGAPHDLVEAAVDLAVGELDEVRVPELDAEVVGDLLGQRRVRRPASRCSRFLVTSSIGSPRDRSPGASGSAWRCRPRWQCRTARCAPTASRPAPERREGPDDAVVADLGVAATVWRSTASGRRRRSRPGGVPGPISAPSPMTVRPCRIVPGKRVTSAASSTVASM